MKTPTITACIALAALFAANANAGLFKCMKDGRTTYQERACAGQDGAQANIRTSKPSPWTGCYVSTGPARGGGAARGDTMEVHQDGGTLYTTDGARDGPDEERLIWAPASPRQLRLMKESAGREGKDGIEVTSGLAVAGTAKGSNVNKNVPEDQIVMGFWWIRGLDIPGDPMRQLPGTKETLRTSKEALYFVGPGAFEKMSKVPCAGRT